MNETGVKPYLAAVLQYGQPEYLSMDEKHQYGP